MLKSEDLQAMRDALVKAATLKSDDLQTLMTALGKAATTESNPIAFLRSVAVNLAKGN
jgi:hypothetical protein